MIFKNSASMFRKINKRARRLKLPFPVYGKGAGDGSRFVDAELYDIFLGHMQAQNYLYEAAGSTKSL